MKALALGLVAMLGVACGGGSDGNDGNDGNDDDTTCGIVCPAEISITLVTRGDVATDVHAAIDAQTSGCKGEGLETSPAITGPGSYADVTVTAYEDGPGSSCVTRIVVDEAYPIVNERLISARLDGDATIAVLAWDAAPGTGIDQVRISFDAGDGTFEDLATVAATLGTFELPPLTGDRGAVTLVAQADGAFAGTSTTVPIYRIQADSYNLSNQSVPGIGFATSLYAVVRAPATDEARPLVLFMHGNHENCVDGDGNPFCDFTDAHECSGTPLPNAEGYLYLMDTLAAQGYVTASISANAINCRDDGISERTQLFMEHLRRWLAWTSDAPPAPFADGRFTGRIDPLHVSVVGHSRGGEAAAAVPEALIATPMGLKLDGAVAIAPTDFHAPAPAANHFALMLGACDGDVADLQGKGQYDRILDDDQARMRSQMFLPGANHNFFNTSWTFDDTDYVYFGGNECRPEVRIGDAAQRAIMEDYLGRWLTAAGGGAIAPFIRADATLPRSTQAWAGVELAPRMSYASADRLAIDDFAAPIATNDLGGANTFTGLAGGTTCTDACFLFEHQLDAARIAWATNASAEVALATPAGLDLADASAVSMRVAARYAYAEPLADDVDAPAFDLFIEDAAGQRASVAAVDALPLGAASTDYWNREVLQTVRASVRALAAANPALDLTNIARIGVLAVGSGQPSAAFWLTNVEMDLAPAN